MGAHHVVDTHSAEELGKVAASFDFILSTVSAPIDWSLYLNALAPKGRLHIVGIVAAAMDQRSVLISHPAFRRRISLRRAGNRLNDALFCARHGVRPITEEFPMSRANEAMAHLEAGKARYRIVVKNDL